MADEMTDRMQGNSDIRNDFQKAKGDAEFYADGTFVHIRNDDDKAERKEMKVGAFAKRIAVLCGCLYSDQWKACWKNSN